MVDINECIEVLKRGQFLRPQAVLSICETVKSLLFNEPNVLKIDPPVTVVGDIHGQFFDLLEILTLGDNLPNVNYLFLGDYVDRGLRSVETISLLFCLKIRYPANVFLIRGNHETRTTSMLPQVVAGSRPAAYLDEQLA
ncbi:putative serine/threonine protein phosphatase [Tieghemiomyces parasiticus]|uniref:Serine/threonine-protein phosphatase n=1 Tax=Tieghemiomyces parasiticus TaxID=78921 RepID=A0A9W7ZZR0_9FUNG|nr:putative serine/threonine protein phosphatase [Tieghemiomyces parasiticus]